MNVERMLLELIAGWEIEEKYSREVGSVERAIAIRGCIYGVQRVMLLARSE